MIGVSIQLYSYCRSLAIGKTDLLAVRKTLHNKGDRPIDFQKVPTVEAAIDKGELIESLKKKGRNTPPFWNIGKVMSLRKS